MDNVPKPRYTSEITIQVGDFKLRGPCKVFPADMKRRQILASRDTLYLPTSYLDREGERATGKVKIKVMFQVAKAQTENEERRRRRSIRS